MTADRSAARDSGGTPLDTGEPRREDEARSCQADPPGVPGSSAAKGQELTAAQKWAREHPMRYREKFGIAWTRYSPGWSLEFGPVWIAWHVLSVWRWGYPKPRLINADRQHLHIGKRLLSMQIRRWW